MEQSEKREQKAREEKKIEVSSIGKAFVKGTHVEFTYHRHRFTGVIEKQLRNSAILNFDPEFDHTNTAIDLKQKIVISYQKMKAIE
ncbi:hypothetical protein [Ligilactobacillus ruminis]|uniref:hypothetical protein n=1 Tax=Ligilactobacillus ruminis TaxID=1623 RepID=UPI0022E26C66|nr:hypothetical protein [Ligilactobacillus ruminis]